MNHVEILESGITAFTQIPYIMNHMIRIPLFGYQESLELIQESLESIPESKNQEPK